MMTLNQIRKAMKSCELTMIATQIDKCHTLYLKADMNDLKEALDQLAVDGVKKMRAYVAQPSNILYIGCEY